MIWVRLPLFRLQGEKRLTIRAGKRYKQKGERHKERLGR
nr:MAG TPA: hypothetical protein [Caudoviricetes sp.]